MWRVCLTLTKIYLFSPDASKEDLEMLKEFLDRNCDFKEMDFYLASSKFKVQLIGTDKYEELSSKGDKKE